MSSITVKFDTNALNAKLDEMKHLIGDGVREIAQAGVQVLYDEVKQNVEAITDKGTLSDAIYQAYSKERSIPGVKATYVVSWNHKKAPHGRLLEWGWIQRYQVYVNDKGEFKTMIRPEKRGQRPPSRRASQAVKDAYYVLRKDGPVMWAPRAFIRRAISAYPRAEQAAIRKMVEFVTRRWQL